MHRVTDCTQQTKMPNGRFNRISTSIHRKLSGLAKPSNEQCIFKVHDRLRSQNTQAYEPRILSIGPYHHSKCNLKSTEINNLMYLQELLIRRREENADRYIIALMELKDRARRCYAEEISLSEDDFVEMLCLDGIFIIEFLRKWSMPELRNKDDKIFQMDWLFNIILRDLILFENQISFFIVDKLFEMTKFLGQEDNLINLSLRICRVLYDFNLSGSHTSILANEVIHLLDLVYKIWCSSFAAVLDEINDPENDFLPEFIKSASELRQSGIKFESAKQHRSWLHITFENGKIKIPNLRVQDYTESIFRNLIAYEQYMTDFESRKFITDYVTFLNNLIDSPRDVEKLHHCQILTNWLGDDEVVATMFNKLVREVFTNKKKFCYSKVYKEVNKYANKRQNVWKANLMRNYFNTPWSIISFFAAVVLLILTFVQTIFSVPAV